MLKEDKAKLKQRLTPEEYDVCVNKGTELPFSGEYWDSHEQGVYHCVVCGNPAVQLRDQVRVRHGLAELLGAHSEGAPSRKNRTTPSS